MARKFAVASALLVMALALSGSSFANVIPTQISFFGTSTSMVTLSPTTVTFNNATGPAFVFGPPPMGTFAFGNATLNYVTHGPYKSFAPVSIPFSAAIDPADQVSGQFLLVNFASLGLGVESYAGFFQIQSSTGVFLNAGFPVGATTVLDFTTLNGKLSSGEVAPVPEPATFAMVGSGLLALAGVLRRKL